MISGNERVVIVWGMPHSGATLLTYLLRQHPDLNLVTSTEGSRLLENDWLATENTEEISNWLKANPTSRLLLKHQTVVEHTEWLSRELPDAKYVITSRPFSELQGSWSRPFSFVNDRLRNDREFQSEVYSSLLESLVLLRLKCQNVITVKLGDLTSSPESKLNELTKGLGLSEFQYDTSVVNGKYRISALLHPAVVSGKYKLGTRGNGFVWGLTDAIVRSDLDLLDAHGNDHEDWIYQHLEVPEGGVFLDIGGFVGSHAIRIAKERNCRTVVFEPVPAHLELMRFNSEVNQTPLMIIEKCVGDFNGAIGFQCDGPGGSQVANNPSEATAYIPLTSVDREPEMQKLERIDIVLIDVEGFEVHVLRGATDTFNKFRPKIIVEVHSHYLYREHNGNLIEKWCEENRYTTRRIWENTPSYFYLEMLPC